MKKMLLVIIGLIVIIFTSCADHRKYVTYECRDSLCSIDIPDSYTFQKGDNNLMVWKDNDNFINVRVNCVAGKNEFKSFVDHNARNLPDKFKVELEDDSNDSVRHFTVHTNAFYTEDIYFYIEGEADTYIIEVTGEGMKTAQKIASSFIEVKELPTKKKTNDKKIFKKEGFAINKEYNLLIYTAYVNQMEKQDLPDKPKLIGAYYDLKNKENPNIVTLFNVNVFDISNQPTEGRLDAYIEQLNAAGIENKKMKFENYDGVVYSYEQNMGSDYVPSKALYVIRDNKYYLINVTTKNNINLQFDKFLKSITFIK